MFTTTDPLDYTITCTSDTWNTHIIKGHVIMANNVETVINTIKDPEVIYKSNQTPTRKVYFSKDPSSTYQPLYTKVVVQIDETSNTGEVVSAWPQKNISGGIDPGGIIYVKNKL